MGQMIVPQIAASKEPFNGFKHNREPMLRVMRKHRAAAYKIAEADALGVVGGRPVDVPDHLVRAAREDWDLAVTLGEAHGYRNAQATVLAPTGTLHRTGGQRSRVNGASAVP